VYGRKRVADKLFGKLADSFDWLYRFKAEVELRSPDSIVEVDSEEIDGKVHFTRFFCCFKAAIDGFRNGCRPYISIDSTHLNGLWNGQLPSAKALDGHNWMFPLAFGFFGSETKDNWIWFMQQLSKAIGPMENLAVCTDACKGLEAAVAQVWPDCEKRECFRHLMENLKKYYTGEVYAKNMWQLEMLTDRNKEKVNSKLILFTILTNTYIVYPDLFCFMPERGQRRQQQNLKGQRRQRRTKQMRAQVFSVHQGQDWQQPEKQLTEQPKQLS